MVQIARLDGTAVGPPTPIGDAGDAALVVSRLEHVVRWEQVRGIGEHPSPLHDAVTLDVYDALPTAKIDVHPIASHGPPPVVNTSSTTAATTGRWRRRASTST